ncbi:MAG: TonB-dependent receptor plug domain-containing protein, partial [Candidatus Latescibacterota bacterium]|nr:TonB-dependent receptor plug domain-containing protein [Candidatus Latescibacterota bacterium]
MTNLLKRRLRDGLLWAIVCCLSTAISGGWAEDFDLDLMSLEDLMEVEVFSASKKEEPLFVAPAAVYVLTSEQIQSSGATTIPDVLRGVPGVEVARIDASKWAVSVRGFNDVFADKLLVMIDGRTVYSPLFNGVIWSDNEIALQDIERIEVVRGPGGALWGANAVNGVINIITRRAMDTKGVVITQSLGTETRARVSTTYGLKIGDWNSALRLHYASYDHAVRNGKSAADNWTTGRIGLRADRTLANGDELSVDLSTYRNESFENYRIPVLEAPFLSERNTVSHTSGSYAVIGWARTASKRSTWKVKVYYDNSFRDSGELAKSELHTWDIDLLHQWQIGEGHQFVWGAGYRQHWDEHAVRDFVYFDLPSRWYSVFNVFAQDEFALLPDRLKLTAGAKVE